MKGYCLFLAAAVFVLIGISKRQDLHQSEASKLFGLELQPSTLAPVATCESVSYRGRQRLAENGTFEETKQARDDKGSKIPV